MQNTKEKDEKTEQIFQRRFQDLLLPIAIWFLALAGLTLLKAIGKWELSGYLAIVLFLIVPSLLEKSNEILGLSINLKREIKFLLFTSAISSISFVLLFLSVKKPVDIELFGIKIIKVFPQIPEVKELKWLIIFFLGVAVPEELFFRGFIQGRLNRFFGRKFEMFGVKFGYGLLIQSVLFMIVHLPQSLVPIRFLVFFPAVLFGILREKYNSIFPSAILHAIGNFFVMFITSS
ncbi:hypothetical protein HRbin19_00334 [bacterium HR19]|nr:hypothetical protein HRbin19_00334 [bacterium HR19]